MNSSATISQMPATDLIGRLITHSSEAEFVVVGLTLHASNGQIWFDIIPAEDRNDEDPDASIPSLAGWTVHQRLLP